MVDTMIVRKRSIAILALLILLQPAFAIIVPGGRTTSGTLDNSGTNKNAAPANLSSYTGQLYNNGSPIGFLGTPIAPQYIITATHIGLGSFNSFVYADGTGVDQTYSMTVVDANNDLAIWKINGPQTFSHYIPLYTGSNEVGLSSVSIGNGTTRGAPVNGPTSGTLAGWRYGSSQTLRSWGSNTINAVVNPNLGTPFGGDFLYFTFTRQVDGSGNLLNPDSGIFSGGDSGGPTFVLDTDNVWKLAGINSLVEQASLTPNGPLEQAALFDARGFYDGANQITGADEVPLGSLATRISSRMDFILRVTAVPEPGTIALMAILVVPGMVYVVRRKFSRREDMELQID